MPPGSEQAEERSQIVTATVINVSGFDAIARLNWKNGASQLTREGALAFLTEEALYKRPVSVQADIAARQRQIEQSRFIRCCDDGERYPLVEFHQREGKLTVVNKHGVELFSQRFYGKEPTLAMYKVAVAVADQVARAKHFLAQTCDVCEEHLLHDLEIRLGLMQDARRGSMMDVNGEDSIIENSKIFISLQNRDEQTSVFVSVFEVEVNGQMNAVTDHPDGIDLPPGRGHTIGSIEGTLKGLEVKWPHNISKTQAVVDTLVLVISSAPVNLQYLAIPELALQRATSNQTSLDSRICRL